MSKIYSLSIIFCLFMLTSSQYTNDYYPFNYDSNEYISYEKFSESLVEEKFYDYGSDDLVCREEITGEPLDWITLYKLPKKTQIMESSEVNNPFIYHGTAYTYMTDKDQSKWHLSDLSMNDTSSFAGRTLDILYRTDFTKSSDIGYILYNDQADKVSLTRGHTKGVIMFNEKSAVWIVHSIPHFPMKPIEKRYQIHGSQCVYGQQFFCMSIKPQELEKIGEQFKYTYPQVYDYYMPSYADTTPYLKNMLSIINGDHIKSAPWSNLNSISTVGGEKLLSFAKFTNFHDDLYTMLVAPHFEADLLTETWNNGRGTLESNCSNKIDHQVHNIEQINFQSLGVRFSVHHDHSKWAVTTRSSKKYLINHLLYEGDALIPCIGDINRQEEQFKRAGGTVCFLNNKNVWKQYTSIISQIEPCRKINLKKRGIQGERIQFDDSNDRIVMLG